MTKDYLKICIVAFILALFLLMAIVIPATSTRASGEKCDTMLCGWCQVYPELCTLYPEKLHLPVIANASGVISLPTLAPTPTYGDIPYPTPITP